MRDPRGFNLIETLVAAAIAIGLMVVVYNVLNRGMEIADSSAKSIQLQQGARNLLENIVRDVNASHIFGNAEVNTFTVLKYLYDDPELVHNDNLGKGIITYPFATDDRITEHRLPTIKCTYEWDKNKEVVTRRVKKGVLISATPGLGSGENLLKMADYRFVEEATVPGEPAAGRVVATNVKKFDMAYFSYDDDGDGQLKEASQVTTRSGERKVGRIAMVLVHFIALFDRGLYKDTLKSPEIEVMTKVWSYKKINDHVYREYFSSQDEDVVY